MQPEWKSCRMKFVKTKFEEFNIGDYIWHNIIGIEDNHVLGPMTVGEFCVINSSNIAIPVSLFGPNIIWYKPIIDNI